MPYESMRFLAEDAVYKVYALEETVYLKRKKPGKPHDEYDSRDTVIAAHYGNPTAALILPNHIVVAGCGISIFTFATQEELHLFAEPAAIRWTNALHQDDVDSNLEFRFVDYSLEKPQLCKMNVLTRVVTLVD